MPFRTKLSEVDSEISAAIHAEIQRLESELQLIPSENLLADAVMQAQGSVLTTKYAEGYPGRRYYGGCQHVDTIENLARDRAKALFGCSYANVQPHSGSSANLAIFSALLNPGDSFMGMSLDMGGHLTHGHHLNFSGMWYRAHHYGVSRETETIDFDMVERIAREVRPRMIICGATAYPRAIDFSRFRTIADLTGSILLADVSHVAGLIVAGEHPSPFPHAHVVMSTTHKTLGGPRGGIILSQDPEIGKKIDKAIIPGFQGGPLMNEIAGKAVALKLAGTPAFVEEQRRIVRNANALGKAVDGRIRLISGGTDNHLLLGDVSETGLSGHEAEVALGAAGITVNKNTVPFDRRKPLDPSGIRFGSVIPSRRGMTEREMRAVGDLMLAALAHASSPEKLSGLRNEVARLCSGFPYYAHLAADYAI